MTKTATLNETTGLYELAGGDPVGDIQTLLGNFSDMRSSAKEDVLLAAKVNNTGTTSGLFEGSWYARVPQVTPQGLPELIYGASANQALGCTFTVSRTVRITRLGRYFTAANTRDHVVNLWVATDQVTPIATGTVLVASARDTQGFRWVDITPVTLTPGITYAVLCDETADQYHKGWKPATCGPFTLVANANTDWGFPSKYPTTLQVGTQAGLLQSSPAIWWEDIEPCLSFDMDARQLIGADGRVVLDWSSRDTLLQLDTDGHDWKLYGGVRDAASPELGRYVVSYNPRQGMLGTNQEVCFNTTVGDPLVQRVAGVDAYSIGIQCDIGTAPHIISNVNSNQTCDFLRLYNTDLSTTAITLKYYVDKSGTIYHGGIEPMADNTSYLGKHSATAPKAYKGLMLRDQGNGKLYCIDAYNGSLRLTEVT